MQYHDSEDLKRLVEFKQLAPTEFSAFIEFDKTVGRDDGSIPRKFRELIAIAVACTTQCPIAWMCTLAQPRARAPVAKRSRKRPCSPPRCEPGLLLRMARWQSSCSTPPRRRPSRPIARVRRDGFRVRPIAKSRPDRGQRTVVPGW